MAEINHRYLKDNDGDTFFPITHIDAIQGINQENTDNAITDINDKINQMNTLLSEASETIAKQSKIIEEQKNSLDILDISLGDMVGDTGWVDISVPTNMKNNAVGTGFKSGIREVRVGNSLMPHYFVIRSIRLNVSGITGATMQIAQLPTGFVTDNQSFMARQHGSRSPVTVECLKDGKVMAYIHPDDQSKTNWLYQEFTWLE
ncbi:hypothetical protein NLV77_000784 [Staphylococcus ureilyticus]|uniref:Uncharacterized protein n=1 Tax=Staphylococcus virus IME1354_01 TaxID=3070820 RepID=A0A1W6JQ70_9CAUD|nr:hypothetical protein [Staphylococcus ureilyticus]YP_010648381.1 hypothetical protein PP279_gp57 [Staphylococcus virus IME1354_01]ARM68389.1 hypothetical protein [Staphylococcus virus IME1354_01]MDV3051849.1 hypothetical protein [Staphylococcus ureilyticus]